MSSANIPAVTQAGGKPKVNNPNCPMELPVVINAGRINCRHSYRSALIYGVVDVSVTTAGAEVLVAVALAPPITI
jgi:hypothetical protein